MDLSALPGRSTSWTVGIDDLPVRWSVQAFYPFFFRLHTKKKNDDFSTGRAMQPGLLQWVRSCWGMCPNWHLGIIVNRFPLFPWFLFFFRECLWVMNVEVRAAGTLADGKHINNKQSINWVFTIYLIMLGWKTCKYYYETDELSPTRGQPNPRKTRLKVAFGSIFSHRNYFFVGWDWFI